MGVREKLTVHVSNYTFEADLLKEPANHDVLRECYLAQHPKSENQWREIISNANPDEVFYRRLRKNSKLIGKGQFAHDVALAIDEGKSFTCPDYLRGAIESAVGGGVE
jgi:putative ATP-dependent endonuclease of OLD family